MSYQFVDAYGSVITADSSIVSGVIHRPVVNIGSILGPVTTTFSGSPSISGAITVTSTVSIGNTPSISGTVNIGNIPSVSGTVGASIIGQLPAGTALLGSVATLQGTNPWITSGSVMLLGGANVIGSIAVLQGTALWNISGSVAALMRDGTGTGLTTTSNNLDVNIKTINTNGSLMAVQTGTRISSIVGSTPSSTLVGTYGHRNDNVSSFLGGNLSWNPVGTDSAGRPITKPFAPEESRIEGYGSTVNTSQTTLVAAAGAGLRNYITDLWFFNTGAAATLITLKDGAGSVLGYTGAPAGSGSNLPGLQTPIRTGANATFDFQATTGTSVLFATVKGFKAP